MTGEPRPQLASGCRLAFPRWVSALLLLGLCCPSTALAFRCLRSAPDSGPSLNWPGRSIEWWLHGRLVTEGPPGSVGQVDAAFSAWARAPCSDIGFRRVGIVSQTEPEPGNGRTEVVYAEAWPHNPSALAITTSLFDPETGLLREVDIELNAEHFEFAVLDEEGACFSMARVDLANTLTHEVGHLLGLAHPPAVDRFAATTMFALSPPCEVDKRSLEEDDIEGLCAIYPAGEPTRPCFGSDEPALVVVEQGEGFDGGCRGVAPTTGGPFAWGLVLLGWWGYRIRRRS